MPANLPPGRSPIEAATVLAANILARGGTADDVRLSLARNFPGLSPQERGAAARLGAAAAPFRQQFSGPEAALFTVDPSAPRIGDVPSGQVRVTFLIQFPTGPGELSTPRTLVVTLSESQPELELLQFLELLLDTARDTIPGIGQPTLADAVLTILTVFRGR